MELKKYPKVDLEPKKRFFLQIGLVVALGLSLITFNWKSTPDKIDGLGEMQDLKVEEEIIPVTRQEEIKPPPPAPQQVAEVLNIVEDDVQIEEEMKIEDVEAKEDTKIDVVEVEEEEEEAAIFFIVEEMPEFEGGEIALRKWIGENTKYPPIARENDIQGKVFVRFCVTSGGAVDKVSIARGVDPLLDQEAIRVVKTLPKWKPGKQRGKAVNVWYTVPINFTLQ